MSTSSESHAQERAPAPERLRLTLFVSGASPASARVESRLRDICDRNSPFGYDLNIVDIYGQPEVVVSRGCWLCPH
jgi:KaiB domain